jgi:hypothetical protein
MSGFISVCPYFVWVVLALPVLFFLAMEMATMP